MNGGTSFDFYFKMLDNYIIPMVTHWTTHTYMYVYWTKFMETPAAELPVLYNEHLMNATPQLAGH